MIRHLSAAHEVTVAAPLRSQRDAENVPSLKTACQRVVTAEIGFLAANARMVARLPSTSPSSFGYFYSPGLDRIIRRELESSTYDLVFGHCSSIAPYIAAAAPPKILDFGDMDSQKWLAYADHKPFPLSLGYWLEGWKLERMEKDLARHFDLSLCTTAAEVATLRSFGTARRSECVPNGVDTDYFAPGTEPYDRDSICFIGRMDYYPNQQCMLRFCTEVFPLLRARRPGSRLTIVGARPSRRVRALGGLAGITVTGSVADVRPFARRAALTIAPLDIARGTQNKILESLAMGVPVVCSTRAAAGVDAIAGEHFLAASRPGEYVDAVVRLLEDPAERARLAAAGRARMLSNHSWSSSMRRLEDLIHECVAGGRATSRSAVACA
jgi:sugar transferase (PEP-CTERM/EpsH1 system associated)